MRYFYLVLTLTLTCLAITSVSTNASEDRTCGLIHIGDSSWHIYTAGATCQVGASALSGVLHHKGSAHWGADNAHSYISYGPWTCPIGKMGIQRCWVGEYSAHAVAAAVDCKIPGMRCPPSDGLIAELLEIRSETLEWGRTVREETAIRTTWNRVVSAYFFGPARNVCSGFTAADRDAFLRDASYSQCITNQNTQDHNEPLRGFWR